jgi:hypothetical protein
MDNMPTEQRAAVIGARKEKEHHNELKEISEGICEDMADSLMAEMRKLAPKCRQSSTQSPSCSWTCSKDCFGGHAGHPGPVSTARHKTLRKSIRTQSSSSTKHGMKKEDGPRCPPARLPRR